jgi:hypothetical protein
MVGYKSLYLEALEENEKLKKRIKELEEKVAELKEKLEETVTQEEYEKLLNLKTEEVIKHPKFREMIEATISDTIHEEIEERIREYVRDRVDELIEEFVEKFTEEISEKLESKLEKIIGEAVRGIVSRLKEELIDTVSYELEAFASGWRK